MEAFERYFPFLIALTFITLGEVLPDIMDSLGRQQQPYMVRIWHNECVVVHYPRRGVSAIDEPIFSDDRQRVVGFRRVGQVNFAETKPRPPQRGC